MRKIRGIVNAPFLLAPDAILIGARLPAIAILLLAKER
jgi:hypothetical protein